MDVNELRRRVGAILAAEEQQPADWPEAERLTDELQQQLHAQLGTVRPEVVNRYLDDGDVRARDDAYAAHQWRAVRRFVETGEYTDSTAAPPWTYALVIALIGGFVLWLVL